MNEKAMVIDEGVFDLRSEKILKAVSLSILAVLGLSFLFYKIVGFDEIVISIYQGRSFGFLNDLITYQSTKSVEHYIDLASILFCRGIFLILLVLGYVNIVIRAMMFKKPPSVIWVFLLAFGVVMGVQLLNPNNRIYSSHGLMHAGIVYEILHGNIPPLDPLLAGHKLLYPWGHHFFAAGLVKVFNVSPTWAFCIINGVALAGCVWVVSKISSMFVGSPEANTLAVLMSLIATSFMHDRAIPIFSRFTNISGMGIGMCFYLLFIYSVLLVYRSKGKWWLFLLPLLISVSALGFSYLQLLPGLLGSFGVFFVYRIVMLLKSKSSSDAKKTLCTAAAVFLGVLLIFPYAMSVSTNAKGRVEILNPVYVWHNFLKALKICLPLLVIIFLNRKSIKEKLDRQLSRDFMFIALGVLITYLFVHLPAGNEYKFLSQFVTVLGIASGISLSFCSKKSAKICAILLLLLFGRNLVIGANYKLEKNFNDRPLYERTSEYVTSGQKAELYEWILSNTSRDDIFVDTKLDIPCLGQRQLYIAMDEYVGGKPVKVPGYYISMDELFRDINVYDMEMVERRWRITKNFYMPQASLDDQSLTELDEFLLISPDVFIVFRGHQMVRPSLARKLTLVFESSEKNFRIYRPR